MSIFGRRKRVRPVREKEIARINEFIRVSEVRVIGEDGQQIGVIPTSEAVEIAKSRGYDLVEISPGASPPVCKIMDYGKYKYQKKKKSQEKKKNQTTIQVKEIQFRPNTDVHDFDFKIRHLERFLSDGNKARVSIRFRGRELKHIDLGMEMMNRVLGRLAEISEVEQKPEREGRNITAVLAPRK